MLRFKPIALVSVGDKLLNQKWSDTLTGKTYIFPLDYDPNHPSEGDGSKLPGD